MKNQLNLTDLLTIIQQRISSQDEGSYVKNLHNQGVEKIAQKIGEEAVEVVIASLLLNNNLPITQNSSPKLKQDLINEFCDLFFHSLILMAQNNITLEEIYSEFYQRNIKNK